MVLRITIFFIVIFLFNPFLGVVLIVLFKIISNLREKMTDLLLFLIMTTYAVLIQSTRVWNINQPSDWYNEGYWGLFNSAGQKNIFQFVFTSFKEPVWSFMNYIFYHFISKKYYYFINSVAILTIFILCYSIYLYWKKMNLKPIVLICSLSFIVFFVEYFSQLNNLTRQFFSLSIIVYAFTIKVTSGKTKWVLIWASCLIHTFSFIYLFLFLIDPLHQKINFKNLNKFLKSTIKIFFILLVLFFISKYLSSISFLSYLFKRIESSSTGKIDETNFDTKPMYISSVLLIIFCLFVNKVRNYKVPVFFTNLLMSLLFICVTIASSSEGLMSRIYISRIAIFPLVIPYFFGHKKNINNLINLVIFCFLFLRYFFKFDSIRGGKMFVEFNKIVEYNILDYILHV